MFVDWMWLKRIKDRLTSTGCCNSVKNTWRLSIVKNICQHSSSSTIKQTQTKQLLYSKWYQMQINTFNFIRFDLFVIYSPFKKFKNWTFFVHSDYEWRTWRKLIESLWRQRSVWLSRFNTTSVKQYNYDNSPNKNNFWFLFCWFLNDCRAARTLHFLPTNTATRSFAFLLSSRK